jgi:fumarate hydratase class II
MSRVERDSLGEVTLPDDALWGAQTQRAINNFAWGGAPLPAAFLQALGHIKACAAQANVTLGALDAGRGAAIVEAADQLCGDALLSQFPVTVFQTGSGTSSNMNANEVLARVASAAGEIEVHPNDHVNMSQSSNDVVPTAIHVSAALALERALLPALDDLADAFAAQASKAGALVKTGRTHLMDAMPVTVAQELGAWRDQLLECGERLRAVQPRLLQLAQGGTAVGTGVNAPAGFSEAFAAALAARTGLAFVPARNAFTRIASQDTAVELSGQLRTLAVALMKIANDLRWMNSGPLMGLGELRLPALQPGSSIMPGKVNPVIPEAVAMVAADVMGNDASIAVAGQSGNFQLNVMLPLVADRLLRSLTLLAGALRSLHRDCVDGLVYDEAVLENGLARNPILVTALNRVVGYDLGAQIAKAAYAGQRPVLDVAEEMTDLSREELSRLLAPLALTAPGVPGSDDEGPGPGQRGDR